MGLIRRSFIHLGESTFLKPFKALVRPHLEYADTVWCPTKMKYIIVIENVQRRAIKFLPTLKDRSYEERVRKLQLLTLRFRRLRGDMIETYKILTGKCDKSVTEFMSMQNSSSTSLPTRGHILKLYQQRLEKGLRQNFFTIRVANQ